MSIETKRPSSKFFKLLDEVIDHQVKSREKYDKAIQAARDEGFTDFIIMTLVRDYLKKKIPQRTVRLYLEELKPEVEESTIQKRQDAANEENNDTEQEVTVTTDGSQTTNWDSEIKDLGIDKIDEVPVVDSEDFGKEEEPTELELAQIRIKQLEEALHKVSDKQFVPATQLDNMTTTNPEHEDRIFRWLSNRGDGIKAYYFDSYGRELFKNRIISQLENSGVKTFRRLYFEV